MSEKVLIKSFANGICIHIHPEIPFEEVLAECERLFHESAKFFKGSKLAVSFEGRVMDFSQEMEIVKVIKSVCEINIVCIVGKDPETETIFAKGIEEISKEQALAKAQFFRGSLEDGERFETDESIIILGDVAKEASIISKKDIIVLGALYGDAYCGVDGKNHFIAALDFEPHKIKIAGYKEIYRSKPFKWGKKQKKGPMMAYLSEGKILTKEIEFTEELLESLK